MDSQNSVVEHQIRPDDLMAELGIKKDAYYAYLKYLGLKAEKDSNGNAFLTDEQANAVRALRSHVQITGKMDGFLNSRGGLAVADTPSLLDGSAAVEEPSPQLDDQLDDLIRAAAELKGQQLVMPQLVIRELANRMTYDDLPEDIKAKVETVREAASPKYQPAQLATDLLNRWRDRQSPVQAA
ncbi:MAG: hypothetical protein NW224_16490 [Leptolyngbyaceae cyanobacterium bins.302]|nr:hypothetical protein [Leptolyngbyaceae cyanobacterium bins.302]